MKKSKKGIKYTLKQKESKMAKIGLLIRSGEALSVACKKAGVTTPTYKSWLPKVGAAAVYDEMQNKLKQEVVQDHVNTGRDTITEALLEILSHNIPQTHKAILITSLFTS